MNLFDIFQGRLTDTKWKKLGEYLKGREIQAGRGIVIENSSINGTVISTEKPREIPRSQAPPFSVVGIRKDGSDWKLQLQEGWVIQRVTTATGDAVEFKEVQIGGSAMSTRERPEITVTHNDFVFVSYTTTDDGLINNTPTIQVGTNPTSTHHQPQPSTSCASSGDGSYQIKLFQFVIDDGGPKIIYYQQSDIEHSRLPTIENVGGHRFLHPKRDGANDHYALKTLEQVEVSGADYGKVIVPVVSDECSEETIKFSAIAERPTTDAPQIQVVDDGVGKITITGNSVDRVIKFFNCEDYEVGKLEFKDGLLLGATQTDVDTSSYPETAITVGSCGS